MTSITVEIERARLAWLLRAMFGPASGIHALPQTAREYGERLPNLSRAHEYTHTIEVRP